MTSIGQQLLSARTERDLSIEDVAFQTRIPAPLVRDMEGDDLSHFANLTYARGFLKLYSNFLELDLSEHLSEFRTEEFARASGHQYVQTASATLNLPPAVFADYGRTRRPGIYILLAVAIVGGGIWWWSSRGKNEEAAPTGSAEKAAAKSESPPPLAVEKKAPAPAAEPVPPVVPAVSASKETTVPVPAVETPPPPPTNTKAPKATVVEEEEPPPAKPPGN